MNDFITSLYGDCTQGVFNLWTKQDIRTYSFEISDKTGIVSKINDLKNNHDVYYEVCLKKQFPVGNQRGKSDEALVIPGLWFDLDVEGPNHKEAKLPTQQEADQFILELPVPPTIIVSSGGGYHLYFLFREHWVFTSDDDREKAKELSSKFQQYIIEFGNKKGWKFDNTSDLARILRVPGTMNLKRNPPFDVNIVQNNDEIRYTPDEIMQRLNNQSNAPVVPQLNYSPIIPDFNNSQQDNHDFPTAYIENIERECAWIRHCKDDSKILSYEEWFAMLSIVDKCEDGSVLAHQWSKPYPEYTKEETDRKLKEIKKAGPRTCENIRLRGEEYCSKCKHLGKIKSPIALGDKKEKPDPSKQFVLSDLGNAERFAYMHGKNLRYAAHIDNWLEWNGIYWQTGNIERIRLKVKETIRSIREGVPNDANSKEIIRHSMNSESINRIKAMLKLSKEEKGIPISRNQLDRNNWLITCRNKTICLKTGKARTPIRNDFITKIVPLTYNPNAKCPRFKKFLSEIMAGNQEMVEFLQRSIGYSLTGNVDEHVIFFLCGDGGNGKSTFLEIISAMMGPYAIQSNFETFYKHYGNKITNDIARLNGSRFVTAIEAEHDKQFNEGLVNKISGGDRIAARFLYGEDREFRPTFKLFWAANVKPNVKVTNEGFWRRIKIVPFNAKFDDSNKDKFLKQKLYAELPGIFNWALEGCLAWQDVGLKFPKEVKAASAEYRDSQDVIKQYLDARVVSQPGSKITKKALHEDYVNWCKANDEVFKTMRSFGARLNKIGYEDDRDSKVRFWKDIELQGVTDEIPSEYQSAFPD